MGLVEDLDRPVEAHEEALLQFQVSPSKKAWTVSLWMKSTVNPTRIRWANCTVAAADSCTDSSLPGSWL
jgi:hypothetical protein